MTKAYARATTPGDFFVAPAHAEETYFPEVFGRSDSGRFTVQPWTPSPPPLLPLTRARGVHPRAASPISPSPASREIGDGG